MPDHREKRRNPVGVDPRYEARQVRALERQEAYDALTTEEKLARLDERPGASARERARLAQ